MASPTPNLGMTYPGHGAALNAWDTPINADFDTLDAVLGGTLAITGGTASFGAALSLTQTQQNNKRIEVSGVLTSNFVISFLVATGGSWVVYNNTTGSFTVTVKTAGSAVTPITISQGASNLVSSNGTDMFAAVTSSNSWVGATYAGSDVAASVSANQNDYNPASLSTATALVLNVTATCSITGLSGGAAGRDLEIINNGSATVQFPANSASSTAANRFANTFALAPSQSIMLRYDASASLWRPKNIAVTVASGSIPAVSNDLLIINTPGTETTSVTITASQVVLNDSNGNAIKFLNVSKTATTTSVGVGSCDLATRAASTNYFLYLVSDGSNINTLWSTSSTSPSLTNATNYIYYKRIGANFTNASSNLLMVRQVGARARYVVTTGSATPNLPYIANTIVGVVGTPTWVAYQVYNTSTTTVYFVPSTAISLVGTLNTYANSGGYSEVDAMVAPNNNYGSISSLTNCPPVKGISSQFASGYASAVGINFEMVLESNSIYYASNAVNCSLVCLGWVDNI